MVVVEYSQYAHFCSFFTRRTVPCTCHTKQHLNVQKGSVPPRFFLYFWTCASRRHGVHFFVPYLARRLRTHRFREPTFSTHYTVSRHSYLFAHLVLLSSDFPFFDLLPSSLLWLFSSIHIDGSLTSKLPSIRNGGFTPTFGKHVQVCLDFTSEPELLPSFFLWIMLSISHKSFPSCS